MIERADTARVGDRLGAVLAWVCLLLATLPVAAPAQPGAPARYVIHAGAVLAEPGAAPLARASVLIEDDHIVEVRPGHIAAEDYAPGARLIDLSTLFVLPGLIDAQVHFTGQHGEVGGLVRDVTLSDADVALRGAAYAQRTLRAGFTAVRDMGDIGEAMFALRDAIAAGLIPGPRMQAAGRIVGPELDAGMLVPAVVRVLPRNADCAGADACRATVRREIERGADTIKIYMNYDLLPQTQPWFTGAELEAMVDTAHARGRKVTASAFGTEAINAALRAGVDAVVHGVFLDAESVRLLRKTNAYFIPTLNAAETVRESALDPGSGHSPRWRRENLEIHRAMLAGFRRAHAAGVRIAFGTDAGWRAHGDNARQFELMVEAGMTPMEALVSASVHAADALGWGDRIGRLQPGYYADLIALRGDPLADITALRNLVFVMQSGRVQRWDPAAVSPSAIRSGARIAP